jgi:CBS domain-containing protein
LREILSTARLPVLHPDQRLDDALRFIQGHALLPVVSRAGSRKLEAVLSLPDVLAAYQKAK